MRDVQRILCPTDFSACSIGALREAVDLAAMTEAEVCLVHVFQDPAYMLPLGGYAGPLSDVIADLRDRGAQELETLADQFREKGARITTLLMQGAPYKAIVDRAQEWKADLIVMGTHGRTGVERALAGSVAERVTRLAPCSVLVTHREA